jgi:hypothetical protein
MSLKKSKEVINNLERENEALWKIQSSQATGVSKGISSGDITAKTSLVSTTTSWITTQDEGKKKGK